MPSLRSQFPVFSQQAQGQPLRHLDNAATLLAHFCDFALPYGEGKGALSNSL